MKNLIQKTNGKKTEGMSVLMLLFQILLIAKPGVVTPETENIIELVISSGVIGTLGHRIWRNRKKLIQYIEKQIQRLKRKEKDVK